MELSTRLNVELDISGLEDLDVLIQKHNEILKSLEDNTINMYRLVDKINIKIKEAIGGNQ